MSEDTGGAGGSPPADAATATEPPATDQSAGSRKGNALTVALTADQAAVVERFARHLGCTPANAAAILIAAGAVSLNRRALIAIGVEP